MAITKYLLYLSCRLKYTHTKTKLFLKGKSHHYFFQRPKMEKSTVYKKFLQFMVKTNPIINNNIFLGVNP